MSNRKPHARPNATPGPEHGTPGSKLSASKETLVMLKKQYPGADITNDTQVRRLLEIITPEQIKRANASRNTPTVAPVGDPVEKKGGLSSAELPSDDPV